MIASGSTFALAYLLAEWAVRLIMLVVIPLRRPPEAARSWLLLVLFLPLPALVLYHLIGRARFPAWRHRRFEETAAARQAVADNLPAATVDDERLSRLAHLLGDFPDCGGNKVELLFDYDAAIDALVEAISRARVSVHLLTYIFADDQTGRRVAEALARARARGVDVRLLVDALGTRPWLRRTRAMLERLDVPIRLALPVRFASLRRARTDLRNHRKICVIDGEIGFVGSQNIVNRDFRPGIVNDELVAKVEGPVVAALASVFATDWYLETSETLPAAAIPAPVGDARLQLMPSGPDFGKPGYERLLVETVHRSEAEVVIVSPYLIPDEALLIALENAVLRGVAVHLIVSHVVDQRLVAMAQQSYYDELLRSGVVIHRYRRRLLHAKHVSKDGCFGIVGSSNADVRSFMLNAEVSLLIHEPSVGAALRAVQAGYIEASDMLTLAEWRARPRAKRVLENIARLVSPLL
jgi:cardiolipin synthase